MTKNFSVGALLLVFSLASSNVWASPDGAVVRGKVEVLEKGGAKRKQIENVLLYLDGVTGASPSAPVNDGPPPTLTSRDKTFDPHALAVPVGTTVTFPNVDDIMHNVFSLSRGNRFDLGLYKSGARKDFVFDNPGLVRVYCNIHPQMSAFVHVLENPFYAWARADGTFEISNVPAGNYTLKVWSEEGETETSVRVAEGGAGGIVVQLDVSEYKKRPHLNKFGKPYKRKRGKY
jgi:plastocyanin